MRVVLVIGTRPEAIKMAPVINELKARSSAGLEPIVVSTGQHREMMRPILRFFQVEPDFDLDLMRKGASLNSLFSTVLSELDAILSKVHPSMVLVHGDTTSAAAASLAAFHRRIKVGHVEAGLRTGNLAEPFPEEFNRRIIGLHTGIHFAPTIMAQSRLVDEGVPQESIVVTGNTVVDALRIVAARIRNEPSLRSALEAKFSFLDKARYVVLVTGHRRENLGVGIDRICEALERLSERRDLAVVYPVHLNPAVREPVMKRLGGRPNIRLIPPAEYVDFVYLMMRSSLILTDSGGVQEEAPSLGKPVLVLRNVTERQEAVAAGLAQLVGTDPERIVAAVSKTLTEDRVSPTPRAANLFGDGRAAEKIVSAILSRSCPVSDRGMQRQECEKPVRRLVGRVANRIPMNRFIRKTGGLEVVA